MRTAADSGEEWGAAVAGCRGLLLAEPSLHVHLLWSGLDPTQRARTLPTQLQQVNAAIKRRDKGMFFVHSGGQVQWNPNLGMEGLCEV